MGIFTPIVNDDSISKLCLCWFTFLIKKCSFSYCRWLGLVFEQYMFYKTKWKCFHLLKKLNTLKKQFNASRCSACSVCGARCKLCATSPSSEGFTGDQQPAFAGQSQRVPPSAQAGGNYAAVGSFSWGHHLSKPKVAVLKWQMEDGG